MGYKPGECGNPNGRPPGKEALTEILRFFADDQINFKPHTPRVEKKIWLARMIWDGLIQGKVKFPDGHTIKLKPNEWLDMVKWVHNRLDGIPRQSMDVTSGDEPLSGGGGVIIILPSNGREIEDSPSTGAADDIS